MKANPLFLALLLVSGLTSVPSLADDAAAPAPAPATSTSTAGATADDAEDNKPLSDEEKSKWTEQVKAKYNLTDAQVKSLTDAGLQGPQMAKAAAFAEASKQPLDKIIQMRTQDGMGWGKIAKTLGIPANTAGKAVSGLRRNEHAAEKARQHADKEQRKADKQAEKDQRKAEREERKAARKAEREQRKADKQQGKGHSN